MTRKHAQTPLHKTWHRRVEGQIRSAMNDHPAWFAGLPEYGIKSLAKRIVGEIVAARNCGDSCGCSATFIVGHLRDNGVPPMSAPFGEEGVAHTTAPSHAAQNHVTPGSVTARGLQE